MSDHIHYKRVQDNGSTRDSNKVGENMVYELGQETCELIVQLSRQLKKERKYIRAQTSLLSSMGAIITGYTTEWFLISVLKYKFNGLFFIILAINIFIGTSIWFNISSYVCNYRLSKIYIKYNTLIHSAYIQWRAVYDATIKEYNDDTTES